MADIQQLTYPFFTDGTTPLNASNLNQIVAKINELVVKVNGGVTPTQTVATPTISISGTTATISCSTSGATIYYTTNGNTPTTSSTQYSSPITLSGACTIKAIAVKSGMNNSSVASQSYSPSVQPVVPTITLDTTAKTVALSATSGLTIKYSTNGGTPTTTYSSPINVASGATIKAISTNGSQSSSVPKITVKYNETGGTIEFTTGETGTIRYTTDGSNPTSSSTAYSSAITPVAGTTYKVAVYNGSTLASEIASIVIPS